MQKNLLVVKKRGHTPLQTIQFFKQKNPAYKNSTISYAGRLDPMAEGLLILLVDEENKKRNLYENLEKDYEFQILFGVTTDTYDILGEITNTSQAPSLSLLEEEIEKLIPEILGEKEQFYPPYSSFHVKGKPLFYYAREKKLDQIEMPKRKIKISHLSLEKCTTISKDELLKSVSSDLKKVTGNFRQKNILDIWQKFLTTSSQTSFPILNFKITCSSGTYVRSLANEIGEKLGCGGIAFTISRTRVGNFHLKDALEL